MKHLPLLALLMFISACNTVQEQPPATKPAPAAPAPGYFSGGLAKYWYEGKAEINTYDLQQARYGELHPGQVNLVFVSEDFLTAKQVKADDYSDPAATGVLKTNIIRRFTTGIYDYSVMSSVFTPTKTDEFPHTLKVTTSMQDWCGQTFTQLNYAGGDRWNTQLRSYFETEGDVTKTESADFLEDEVFNRIRSGWEDLPVGNYRVLPSTAYLVMMHQPYAAHRATTSLGDFAGDRFDGDGLKSYVVDFVDLGRRLEVVFEAQEPFVVRGWTETVRSRGKELTTVATLTHRVREPYWSQNSVSDGVMRAALGL